MVIFMVLFCTIGLAQTKSLTIPVTAFKPMTHNGEYYMGESFGYTDPGATYRHWGTPIYLPDGAKIVKVTLFYSDDTGSVIRCRLRRTNLYNGTATDNYDFYSDLDGTESVPAAKSESGYMVINNSGYAHIAWLYFYDSGDGARVWAVKLIYIE